ncbi:MAG: anthranilate synthase component I family protein [Saprospiraceae bacterium]|nr:anthranilate synthase component I family protein [Saprospiraceae bacterium]
MVKKLTNSYPKVASFPLAVPLESFKAACLEWAAQFDPLACYDSNSYKADRYGKYEALIGAGATDVFSLTEAPGTFAQLKDWYEQAPNWAFGFLSYDLKNDVEQLQSENSDGLAFPLIHFFRPIYVLEVYADSVRIHSQADAPEQVLSQILAFDQEPQYIPASIQSIPNFQAKISKKAYLERVEKIRDHIIAGDVYEMNFCQEFFAENVTINPLTLFKRLNRVGAAPLSAYYRLQDQYLLSASPERFIQKTGTQLISQPIKGTIRRGANEKEDHYLQSQLYYSEKDRAENIMIVDLVRNDLARSCVPGTIRVEELFGIYTFQQVFQMISTVSGTLKPDVHFIDALKLAFPMGSMTGAPKIMSMQLIEAYEESRRGLYSGAVGYITPDGDFDFNVVIRSLQYNAEKAYLSYQVGGAIVFDSDPQAEYEECLLKAKGILSALGIQDNSSTSNPNKRRSSQKAG